MSRVTDVVVHVNHAPKGAQAALVARLPFDEVRHHALRQIDTEHAGGGKVFCGAIYAGAFNHVDVAALVEWFRALPWGTSSSATMSWATEGEFFGIESVGWEDSPAWGR